MQIIKLLLFVVFLFSASIIKAQQPAYFIFGEDQFRGVHVYDVIQDRDLNYWFATNEGIFLYDHIEFQRVDCERSKSNSVYNFVMDSQGVIYCHNLNNQIFQIKDKRCKVFYELTDVESGSDVSLAISDERQLLVASKWIVVISPEGNVVQRKENKRHYIGPPLKYANKILYHLSSSDTLLVYSKGQFEYKRMNWDDEVGGDVQVLKFLKFNDGYLALDYKTKKVYHFDPRSLTFKTVNEDNSFSRSESVRMYETTVGVWIAGTLPGVLWKKQSAKYSNTVFYEDYFVSDVFEDTEGNILISTFDKGILVIPDLKIPDVIHPFKEDPVTTLHSNGNNGLLLGTSKGLLLNYHNDLLIAVNENGKRPIEVIGGSIKSEWNIIDNGRIRAINKSNGKVIDLVEASLKDIVCISESVCFLGTNRGLLKVELSNDGNFKVEVIKEIDQRVHFMEYDPVQQILYLSTANGVISRNNKGHIKSVKYKNEDLFPNDFCFHKGTLYICSKENGLLAYENGKFSDPIQTVVNGQKQTLKKIIFYRETIIAQGSNGFFQFDCKGNLLKSLHTIYGLSSKRVIDFTFHEGQLWVSHSGGVQKIDLNYKPNNRFGPVIRIDRIYVNGKEIDLHKKNHFSSNERKIQFYFSSPSLKNRETIRYHYRLLGNDSTWYVSENGANQVKYNALSSGEYIFQVRTENQGVFSRIESFEFKIAAPLYLRWWFIALTFIVFVGLVFMIYRRQLAVQQRKSDQINELHASKLTAIQSQMNPHFIFNSLNSIQDLILKGDVEHSYSYITTFSNLVRRTLNYSEKDFIDFEQEVKLLDLYLSLEKLRFKKDFYFTMDFEGVEDVMIPPLLVQPFIENALVHGLLHKEGEKRLKISFHLDDYLICTIEDNGIGRKASREIKQRQRLDHESFSSEAIRKRFDILSKVFEGEFGYEFVDLFDDGKPAGTKVIMKIPLKHKF